MKVLLKNIFVVCISVMAYPVASATTDYPAQLSIVLQVDGQWGLYLSQTAGGELTLIDTVSEPRTPTVCWSQKRIAYVSAAGALREIDLTKSDAAQDTVLLEFNTDRAYTQPAFGRGCDSLYMVELKQGKSVDTDIVELKNNKVNAFVSQRSAQFEPYLNNTAWLYYANVACVVSCGQIIQEIWRTHTVSRVAEQLTLTNAISREPVASADDRKVYFSSNRAGHFHIWQLDRITLEYRQLTKGAVIDAAPAIDARGAVYFIRQTATGTELRRFNEGESSSDPLPLPAGVTAARDLEIAS